MKIGDTQTLRVLEHNRDTITLGPPNVEMQAGAAPSSAAPSGVAPSGAAPTAILPSSEAMSARPGDLLEVFLFSGSNGNLAATTQKPLVECDQCASLKVVDITNAGAFLDWGLTKNLLLPFAEQRRPVEIGRYESVLVYVDNSGRLAASSRLDHHLPESLEGLRPWQAVSLLVYQRTDLGLKAVVDNQALGLLYKDEIFQAVRVGETHQGYVKRVRHDGRIDLSLQPRSKQLQPDLAEAVLGFLQANDGVCHLSDKSSPEAIQATFKVSKKNFKKALSTLYRERKIIILDDRIELVATNNAEKTGHSDHTETCTDDRRADVKTGPPATDKS